MFAGQVLNFLCHILQTYSLLYQLIRKTAGKQSVICWMTLFEWRPGYFVVKIRYIFFTLFVLMTKLLANNTFVIFRIRICHSVYADAFTSSQINCATYQSSKQFTQKYRLLYRTCGLSQGYQTLHARLWHLAGHS